ncbi:MAG: FUN14 domain-containing protein [Candidatus Nitrosopolaris sp.]|jgi:hypothetical protein
MKEAKDVNHYGYRSDTNRRYCWRRFFLGFIVGYALKKVIKLAAVIVGLFIAAVAYLEYQRILNAVLDLVGNSVMLDSLAML